MRFKVRLQPRGSKNEILGWDRGCLKAKVSPPPLDGAANRALLELLSRTFKVAKSRIHIVAGETSRNKSIEITGSDPELERTIQGYVRT